MKRLFVCYLLAVTACPPAYADEGARLVGSRTSTKEVTVSATDIVLGKFTKVRPTNAASMLGVLYNGEITISQALKGNKSGSLEVGFSVIPIGKDKEAEPNLRDTYIMFITDQQVLKLLPATDENISRIKSFLAPTASTEDKLVAKYTAAFDTDGTGKELNVPNFAGDVPTAEIRSNG